MFLSWLMIAHSYAFSESRFEMYAKSCAHCDIFDQPFCKAEHVSGRNPAFLFPNSTQFNPAMFHILLTSNSDNSGSKVPSVKCRNWLCFWICQFCFSVMHTSKTIFMDVRNVLQLHTVVLGLVVECVAAHNPELALRRDTSISSMSTTPPDSPVAPPQSRGSTCMVCCEIAVRLQLL